MNGHVGADVDSASDGTGFRMTEHWFGGTVVVAAIGDLDMFTAPLLADVAFAAVRTAPTALVVDLTQVNFLASAGMNLLVDVHQAMPRSARFGIVAAGPATSRPLMLTGIDNVMTVYRSLDDAFDALSKHEGMSTDRDVVGADGDAPGESLI